MLNPADLIHLEPGAREPGPQPGVLIVALGGFVDAGRTQQLLAEHLLDESEGEVVASLDVDQLLDYRGRRPAMVFESSRWASYSDPAILMHRLTDRDGTTYYVLHGPEPDYQWERSVEAIRILIQEFGISLVVSAHGIPMAVPHTRPLGMTAHANEPEIIGDRNPVFGTVQVPASLSALLELRLGEIGHPAAGFAVHVPHYLSQAHFPDAALTALNAISDLTGLNLPNDALVVVAGTHRAEIAGEVASNDEVAEAVSALERQYDTFMEGKGRPSLLASEPGELPSADELGADFEEFLRTVEDDGRG